MGRDEGLTEEKLAALNEFEHSDAFSHTERLVLRLADGMAATPAEVSEGLFQSLSQEFSERQLVELASALAWENYRSRFNRVFDVESQGFSAGAFCPLPVRRMD